MGARMHNVKRLGTIAVGLVFLVTLLIAADPRPEPDDESVARGRFLYRVYCLNCHGEVGHGDGVSAPLLKIEPADLTRLSRKNDGEFPFDRVYHVIDGREEIRGHGARRMPIWGLGFQDLDNDMNQEDEVRKKTLHVIAYLQSIQGR